MANAPPDFGSCWSCVQGLTMPATIAYGFRAVGEAIARRWYTPRGGLIDDPNYGFDLTEHVGDDLDQNTISQLQRGASLEAQKDERVLRCQVSISLANGALIVTGAVQTALGPFRLVVSVDQVTVTLLQVTP